MFIKGNHPAVADLIEALGLDGHAVRSLDIHIEANDIVTAAVVFVTEDAAGKIVEIVRRHLLRAVPAPAAGGPLEGSRGGGSRTGA